VGLAYDSLASEVAQRISDEVSRIRIRYMRLLKQNGQMCLHTET